MYIDVCPILQFLELLRERLDSFTIDQFLEYYKSIPNIPPEVSDIACLQYIHMYID